MCTIVAGQLAGLSTSTAAEFSFLLALPTLGAATLYELYKGRGELFASVGISQLVVGLVVSFLVGCAFPNTLSAVSSPVAYIERHDWKFYVQLLAKLRRDQASPMVGPTARRVGHDQVNRSRGISRRRRIRSLCPSHTTHQQRAQQYEHFHDML